MDTISVYMTSFEQIKISDDFGRKIQSLIDLAAHDGRLKSTKYAREELDKLDTAFNILSEFAYKRGKTVNDIFK